MRITDTEPADFESLLSIQIVREHCKIDDDPTVTDAVLDIYRRAAIEQAELYTGLKWSGVSVVEQSIQEEGSIRRARMTVNLRYPVYDGVVAIVGRDGSRTINVVPGARRVTVPIVNGILDGCCHPCGSAQNYGMRAVYRTGWDCKTPLPYGILLGCLKFIAWSVNNPGSTLVTMNDGSSNSASGVAGTNNSAWASGALELWRSYSRIARVA